MPRWQVSRIGKKAAGARQPANLLARDGDFDECCAVATEDVEDLGRG
jgi:hypothetical protein